MILMQEICVLWPGSRCNRTRWKKDPVYIKSTNPHMWKPSKNEDARYSFNHPLPLQKENNKTCFHVPKKRIDDFLPNLTILINKVSFEPDCQRTLPSVSMKMEEEQEVASSISMVSSTSWITGISWKPRTLLARLLCLTLRTSFSDRGDFLFFLFLCFLLLLTTMNRIVMSSI